eukprot:CAMPEP_0194534752 /NCGR_PEP_ID=MMETSP0253-20130528/73066_1 /TAXON_ID=2966 /ORGANISM="Noctiluca scintillans" /LENGTH=209 /DNA_ID=CAMNT_0039380457 /DNA_START=74 /DNA_END=704 /DNA_ORIENTATION=+
MSAGSSNRVLPSSCKPLCITDASVSVSRRHQASTSTRELAHDGAALLCGQPLQATIRSLDFCLQAGQRLQSRFQIQGKPLLPSRRPPTGWNPFLPATVARLPNRGRHRAATSEVRTGTVQAGTICNIPVGHPVLGLAAPRPHGPVRCWRAHAPVGKHPECLGRGQSTDVWRQLSQSTGHVTVHLLALTLPPLLEFLGDAGLEFSFNNIK